MKKKTFTSYTDNRIGSGQYCECGKEMTHDEARYNKDKYIFCCHERQSNDTRTTAGGEI